MPTGDQIEVEVLCDYLPALVADGGVSDWERKFCASLIRQRRLTPSYRFSERQVVTLRRIVRAFQERTLRGPVPEGGWRPVGEVAAGMIEGRGDDG